VKPRVLVVEDDPKIRTTLELYLTHEGFDVRSETRGDEAVIAARDVSLVILDIMLPGRDGIDICRAIRAASSTPIIFLTARSTEDDKLICLDVWADDYVTKPFSPRELLARVRAALRRSSRSATSEVNGFGGISVDFIRMEVIRDGQPIGLTAQEFKTLKFLMQNAERVISRDELLNEVWGYQNYPSTRTVDNHILKLRQKLEKDPANPVHFRTVHGMGYKFVR
jgi:DNA-binding response OmpR family regulator